MKKVLFFLLTAVLIAPLWSCSDDDELVVFGDIPSKAQVFVESYFPGAKVVKVERDGKHSSAKYDVYLSDGTEIEFDSAGEWIDVDAPYGKAVPAAIVPSPIAEFVVDTYPDQLINEFSRESYGYKAELTNEVELEFDHDYVFIRIER